MNKDLVKIWQQVPPDYYDQGISSNFFQHLWHNHKLKIFKKIVDGKNFTKILDVGCASGILTNHVSQIFRESEVHGVDIYKRSIGFGKKKYPHINFVHADAHKLPFRDNWFDLVISYETIEHVVNPEKMLKELRRVVSKKGQAIVAMDSGSLLFRLIWWFWEKTRGRVWKGAHLHPYTHHQLEQIIIEAGFKILAKKFSHLGMEVIFLLKK